MTKIIKISDENHQKMEKLKAEYLQISTFDEVLTMLLEEFNE